MKARTRFKPQLACVLTLLFLFISGGLPLHAQPGDIPLPPAGQKFRFTHLTAQEGLPDFQVVAMLQDHQGFMWFGTTGGLGRYDGYEFTFYQHTVQDNRSLINNYVRTLFEDRTGTLWVGTSGGLDRYDAATDTFVHYQHDSKDDSSLPNDLVPSFLEDQAGRLWVGTKAGLSRLDRDTGKFLTYQNNPADPSTLSGTIVFDMAEDPETGRLWLGSLDGGVNLLDPATGRFAHYRHDPNDPTSLSDNTVYDIFRDRKGIWWFGTAKGLDCLDPATKTFAHYKHNPEDPSSLVNDFVRKVYEDSHGRFWVATPTGLDLFDRQNGAFTHVRNDPDDPTSFSENSAWDLFEDGSGAMWFSTATQGVNRLSGEPAKFVTYQNDPKNPNSLSRDQVKIVYPDRAGELWLGTSQGLNRLDGENLTRFLNDPNDPTSLSHDDVTAITQDTQGNLWIGADVGGLNRFDGAGFVHYSPNPNDPGSLGGAGAAITFLYPETRGGLWIGLGAWGIDYFNGKTFTHYRPDSTNPGSIPTHYVSLPAQDQQGALWLPSDDKGLVRFDPVAKSFTAYLLDPEHPDSEINKTIVALYADRDGGLWVGGASGLIRFDPASGKLTQHYTRKDGLPAETVEAILGEAQGNLWLSTAAGLSKFNPATGAFRNYVEADGLPSNSFIEHACAQAPDGRMFFGSTKGLVAFYPDRLQDNPHVPPVVLTGFELFNAPVEIGGKGSPLQKAIQVADEVTLRYDQSVFTVKFAALDYASPEKNQYAYRLEGFDTDWRDTPASRRFATYTNLNPGTYTLRVRGSNNDGLWNETGTSITIIIMPPWWGTWWFRSLAVLTLLGLAFTGFRWRVSSLRARTRELERQVAARTRELVESNRQLEMARDAAEAERRVAEAASQAKSTFLANMSHELRSPLNTILGFTRLVARQPALPPQTQADLGIVLRSGEHLHTLINQVLDLSKIEAGRATLHETNFDLYRLLDDLEDMFASSAEEKGLLFSVERHPEIPRYVHTDEVKLRQVLINLLSNAFKFTTQGSVTLRVAPTAEDPSQLASPARAAAVTLHFELADTGPGIAPHELESLSDAFVQAEAGRQAHEGTGLGLTISRSFIQLMGGELRLQSQVAQGTTVSFGLPVGVVKASQAPPPTAAGQRRVIALEPGASPYRILVADDRWSARQLLIRLLAPLGFEVREASQGQEALAIWEAWNPHLIWMDLRMPVLDGREATRHIKAMAKGQATVIIALTASSFEEERAAVMAVGFNDFLRKPFRDEDLFELMHKHLGVRFVYEPKAATPAITLPDMELLTSAALAALPSEQLMALERALVQLDTPAISRAIDAIRPQAATLAAALAALAQDYQYGHMLRLIRSAHGENGPETHV